MILASAGQAQQLPGERTEPDSFTIHFENVELPIFVKFISKVTGRKFVFSDRVSGGVTVISPVPVTAAEAIATFESVLAVRGLTMIDDGIITRIVPMKDARTAGGAVVTDGDGGAGFATRLLPLRHVQADEVATVLESMVSKEGSLVAYPATNTVIVSDAASNLERISQVVRALDIPSHEESVEVIALEHADAATLAQQLEEILATGPRAQRPAAKDRGQAGPGERFKIVPDARTNALVVIADPSEARRIRSLANSLDTPLDPGDARINVYYARHADAVALVGVLAGILSEQRRVQARTDARVVSGQAPGASGEEISLAADPATNSVIVNASLQDYKMIRRLLEDLDIERPQVFVEAIIAEVSMDRSRELGFEFQAGGDIGNGTGIARTALSALNPLLADPASLSGLIAAAVSDRTIELPDGREVPAQVALLRALAADSDINVLSAPTLLTLDNQEARIVVGENVPFVTSQGVDISSVSNVFTTIERRDVGIKLTVTPQVSEGDVIILAVEEEVSALVENDLLNADAVGPTTTIRSAETTVSVKDGRTAVIGGLIANSVQKRASKVPLLGDIPVLGRLFRTDASRDQKVNLIVILTPHIVRNSDDMARVSETQRAGFRKGVTESNVPFPQSREPYIIPESAPVGPADAHEQGIEEDQETTRPRWPVTRSRGPNS